MVLTSSLAVVAEYCKAEDGMTMDEIQTDICTERNVLRRSDTGGHWGDFMNSTSNRLDHQGVYHPRANCSVTAEI